MSTAIDNHDLVGQTVKEALNTIEIEQKKRLLECQAQINEILESYGMDIVAMPLIAPDGRVTANPALKFKE